MRIPDGTTSIIKMINRDPKTPDADVFDSWLYVQDGINISTPQQGEKTSYNPKKRPWYINAMKTQELVWSSIYIFKSAIQGKAGLTASKSVVDRTGQFRGVFGADITLDRLSDLLHSSKITQNTSLYIIDEKNRVISSSLKKNNISIKEEQFEILTASNFGDSLLEEATKKFNEKNNKEDFISFNSTGEEYIAMFNDFPKFFSNEWKIVVIAPKKDFIQKINENFDKLMIYSGVILIISFLLAFQMARRISRPIRQLSKEALKIQNLDLEGKITVHSPIQEIEELASAMRSLKTTMQSFSYYIPKNLVKKMLNAKQTVQIGGKSKTVTLMFTDVEGFTSISERVKPEALVLSLSEYFEELTRIIMDHNGTVDKYIGDAIMAFWGAPLQDRHHNFNACRTALLCQKRLDELNRRWKSEEKPVFNTRIGIHAGDVIIGNIGSSERMNYSALGDNVNIGARLEGLNKFYGTKIIVSDAVYDQMKGFFLFRPLDRIAVKGKTKALGIYELVAQTHGDMRLLPTDEQMDYCAKFDKAYKLFLTRQFSEALSAFQKILKKFRSEDLAVQIYVNRCHEFIKSPPPQDWDGSSHMTSK